MITVTGKAIIELPFTVDLDVDDISTKSMSINTSDELIAEAILDKYGQIPKEIFVEYIN